MAKSTVQVKFTIDFDTVAVFKARCAAQGVSMASVICQFMKDGHPVKGIKMKASARPHRRKAVLEIIGLLEEIMEMETKYRDNIPEQFEARYEAADQACDHLAQAISYLEDAF